MPRLSRPQCELYYEETGEGPAIVFAHGAGGNHLSWWQQVPVFRSAYRCVSFDHRGWGQSIEAPGGPGPNGFADDLIALLDELGIERAALVAQSMGGWTCLAAAVQHPERVAALVMADTLGGLGNDEIGPIVAAAREKLQQAGLASLAYHPNLRERRPDLAYLYDEVFALNPPRDPALLGALARVAPDAEAVAALPMPVLWVVGSEDAIMPAEAIRLAHALVPGSSYFEVPSTGHSVYFERPEQFNLQLSAFLVEAGWGEGAF